ncbi:hypothetical protein OSF66_002729 [Vibrio vulnificus]|nr:hypothetical protein [Vibrio vulnificus]MCU8251608.1 hypothetical protein [Vibrio vulnificus]HDY7531093.1 hypothetical protein [Vibrio vulnificus]
MNDSGFNTNSLEEKTDKDTASPTTKTVQGNITQHIGSGENAKNSFIWMTITWSFIIGSGITFLIYLRSFFFDEPDTTSLIESIATVWTTFVPLITLALGYAFGKGETK